jgi:hypothetical protein
LSGIRKGFSFSKTENTLVRSAGPWYDKKKQRRYGLCIADIARLNCRREAKAAPIAKNL